MPHHRPPGVYVSSLFKLLRQCCVRQQDVVNALGVSRAEVSDWATGRRPIRGRFLAPVQDIIGEAIRRLNDHHDHAMQQDPEAVAWWNTAEKTDLATSPYPYLWLDPGQTASVTLSAWWAWHTRMCDLWEEWDLERAQPELIEELDGINRAVSRLNIDGIEKLAASLYDSGQRATFLRLYARAQNRPGIGSHGRTATGAAVEAGARDAPAIG